MPKRNGRGRPPTPRADAQTVKLSIRVNEADARRIGAVAKEKRLPVGTWIRSIIIDELVRKGVK